jgi:hypothetical protein
MLVFLYTLLGLGIFPIFMESTILTVIAIYVGSVVFTSCIWEVLFGEKDD